MKRILLSILVLPFILSAQVQMNGSSGSYSQNFNTLSATTSSTTWTDNSVIPNWYAQRTSTGPYNYAANAGTATAGGLYSYGSAGSSDRALGSIGSENGAYGGNFAHGVQLQNTGTDLINVINLNYTLEQWRNGGSNSPQDITVWFKISTTAITSLTPSVNTGWTQVSALTGSSLQVSNTAGALNGNTAVNRATLSGSISATVPVGSFIMIKWEDPNHNGSDDALALDDVVVTWGNCPPTAGTDVITACDSITWIDGNTYTSSNNSATFNLLSSTGCDSLVTLDLTVNYSGSSYLLQESCTFPFLASNGSTYNAPGVYTNSSVGSNGCPIIDTVDVVQINASSFTVIANESAQGSGVIETADLGLSYQWLNCTTQADINGETATSFSPQSNGSYAVTVEFPGNCFATSNCVLIDYLTLEEYSSESFKVYPNPGNGQVHFYLPESTSFEVSVVDLNGKILYSEKLEANTNTIYLPELSRGQYLIKVKSNKTVYQEKLIIE